MTPPERLNRHLARRTGLSRRAADLLIAAGRVRVGGRVAALGTVVEEGAEVRLDQRVLPAAAPPRTVLLNKPSGVVSTRFDPQGRPTVVDLVGDRTLVPVGRLDADSRGLLLLSSDGALTERLTHPRHGVEKLYRLTFARPLPAGRARAAARRRAARGRPGASLSVRPARGGRVEVVMTEGRKREVRRLCAALDLELVDLERIGFGPLRLASLPVGHFRELEAGERAALLPRSRPGRGSGGAATMSTSPAPVVITVDGPAGSGKSTLGRRLGQALSLPVLDSGLFYRGLTVAAVRGGVDPADPVALVRLAARTVIELNTDPGAGADDWTVRVDGIDVSGAPATRTPRCSSRR